MRGVSRPPRYDHFDIPPYYDATYAFFAFENLFSNHNGYFTTNLFACQVFLSKITHFILFIFTYFLRVEPFFRSTLFIYIFLISLIVCLVALVLVISKRNSVFSFVNFLPHSRVLICHHFGINSRSHALLRIYRL